LLSADFELARVWIVLPLDPSFLNAGRLGSHSISSGLPSSSSRWRVDSARPGVETDGEAETPFSTARVEPERDVLVVRNEEGAPLTM
jgi:hypothetical protein